MYSNNPTADYLNKKRSLEQNIRWYSETIEQVEKQQEKRRRYLSEFQEQLHDLEKEYYSG